MGHVVNHVHLKSDDPKATADWFVKAFGLEIRSDDPARAYGGDRFLRCFDGRGFNINISGVRTKLNEKLGPADDDAHYGLEHFGFDVDDMDAELERLKGLGAVLKEGPLESPTNRIAFIGAPGGIRIELIQQK